MTLRDQLVLKTANRNAISKRKSRDRARLAEIHPSGLGFEFKFSFDPHPRIRSLFDYFKLSDSPSIRRSVYNNPVKPR